MEGLTHFSQYEAFILPDGNINPNSYGGSGATRASAIYPNSIGFNHRIPTENNIVALRKAKFDSSVNGAFITDEASSYFEIGGNGLGSWMLDGSLASDTYLYQIPNELFGDFGYTLLGFKDYSILNNPASQLILGHKDAVEAELSFNGRFNYFNGEAFIDKNVITAYYEPSAFNPVAGNANSSVVMVGGKGNSDNGYTNGVIAGGIGIAADAHATLFTPNIRFGNGYENFTQQGTGNNINFIATGFDGDNAISLTTNGVGNYNKGYMDIGESFFYNGYRLSLDGGNEVGGYADDLNNKGYVYLYHNETGGNGSFPVFSERDTITGDVINAYGDYDANSYRHVFNGGDIEIDINSGGIIMYSPDDTGWRITVDNTGALTTTAI